MKKKGKPAKKIDSLKLFRSWPSAEKFECVFCGATPRKNPREKDVMWCENCGVFDFRPLKQNFFKRRTPAS